MTFDQEMMATCESETNTTHNIVLLAFSTSALRESAGPMNEDACGKGLIPLVGPGRVRVLHNLVSLATHTLISTQR